MAVDIQEVRQKLLEFTKCKNDPIYFIETYVRNPQFENESIKLRDKQKEIIRNLQQSKNIIINGSRQTGKTTAIELFIVWLVTFFKNYTVFVMSKKGDSTAELLKEIFDFFLTLPEWLRPKVIKDNTFTKEFSNGSRIKGVTVPKGKEDEAGRGMKGGFIFLDEVAFFDADINKIYTALVPTTTYIFRKYDEMGYPHAIAMVSTPNGTFGRGEFFFRMWTKALNGEVDFVPIRYHWTDVPEYANDPNWIKEQRKKFPDEREFNQEYELVFLGSKLAFFPDSIIGVLQSKAYKPIDSIRLMYDSIDIYESIDPNKPYLIGIDTASGYDEDFSAIIITDYETGLPIAEYQGKVTLEEFKEDIIKLIEKLGLKNFLLIPERNGIGSSISQWLASTEYKDHVYFSLKGKDKYVPGLSTDAKTRPLMFEALYDVVSENAIDIKPQKLKNELIALEKKGKRVEAPQGLHDDLALAYCFTCYVRHYGDTKILSKVLSSQSNLKQKILSKHLMNKLYSLRYGTTKQIAGFDNDKQSLHVRYPFRF